MVTHGPRKIKLLCEGYNIQNFFNHIKQYLLIIIKGVLKTKTDL